jgi:hypothetical protein
MHLLVQAPVKHTTRSTRTDEPEALAVVMYMCIVRKHFVLTSYICFLIRNRRLKRLRRRCP